MPEKAVQIVQKSNESAEKGLSSGVKSSKNQPHISSKSPGNGGFFVYPGKIPSVAYILHKEIGKAL